MVTTTANVIYTIPTNNTSRFSTANVSASTTVRHSGKLFLHKIELKLNVLIVYSDLPPPSYDQVVSNTPIVSSVTETTISTDTSFTGSRPPSFSQTQAEVPKPA